MPNSDFEDYKRRIKKQLAHFTEIFSHISRGDFPPPVDCSTIEEKSFVDAFKGLNSMSGSLKKALEDVDKKEKEMEEKVRLRTGQLDLVNKQLTQDIAELRIMEEALRQSEEQYRLLAESAHDFIFIVDRKFTIRYVNEFGAKVLNGNPSDLIGKKIDILFPSHIAGQFEIAVKNVFETSRPSSVERKVQFPGGEVWLETKLIPISGKDGRFDTLLGISRDISDRKKAQEAVVERERFYSNIFSSILDGISIVDKDLTIIQVNPFMEKWYSHFMPLAGKKCYEVYHQADKPCEVCPTLETLKTGKAAHEVVPKRLKNGVICGWTDLHTFPLVDSTTGETWGVIENVRDITERKKIEEDLRQSEEMFRTLADTAEVGIFIVKNSRYCYVNHYVMGISGYSQQELYSMNFLKLIHPDFVDTIKVRYQAWMRGDPLNPQIEFKGVKKSGEILWLLMSSGLIEYEGEPAVLATIIDISERKKVEQALSAEKDRLDVTLSSIGDSVISTDSAGTVITINKMAETLTGYNREESVGKNIDDICRVLDEKTNEPHERILSRMIEKHGVTSYKRLCTLVSRDNTQHRVDFSVSPIRANDGSAIGIVLVFRDITEKQKLEDELFKARKLESLGVLAGGIAHDFNNILTGVITNLFMAKLGMPVESEGHKLLVDAEKACFRASRLTKQLLTFSKGGVPVKELCSVKELIEETVGFCLSGSNAGYRLELPDDLMAANIDKGQIDQVINNLLINAQQAMPLGGTIVVSAENVEISRNVKTIDQRLLALDPGAYVKVSISDDGMGIAPEDFEKIFDPYFTTKARGNGLGLTTSYSIIKNHNGIILVDSELGCGSVFSFYLPAVDLSLEDTRDQGKPQHAGNGKILVMDDDDAVRTVVSRLLKGYGYRVQCTATGDETLQAYKNACGDGEPFDVVIMDLTIPGGIGGKETIKLLKEFDPSVKGIVASGYSNDPIMANFREYGFKGVIVKPFNVEDFVRTVEGVICS
jgi:PAS domain S-box/PAS domain S-box/PAS domain S-box/PAS domain S-box